MLPHGLDKAGAWRSRHRLTRDAVVEVPVPDC
jgi:hypothetical protein